MIRGGSCEFRFDLPYDFSELDSAQIKFWQDNYSGPSSSRPLPIWKVLAQCDQGSKPTELRVILNREETLRFTDKRKVRVQLSGMTKTGIPIMSKERLFTVYPSSNDLDEDIQPTPDYDGWIRLDGGRVVQEV